MHRSCSASWSTAWRAYGGRGRLITASSAGFEDECRTTTELDKSDGRRWFLRCPACDRENTATWENVIYKGREHPVYLMPCCGAELGGVRFRHAIGAGRWKPTKAPMVPGIGRVPPRLHSCRPFESLATIVRQWRRADAHRKQTGSMAEVIAFQCGRLALPFKPAAAQGVTPEGIASSCREDYDPAVVPAGASVVVGAVDVQDNRLEAELSAWGVVEVATAEDASNVKGWASHEFRGLAYDGRWYRLRRWALDYRRIAGDPGADDVWNELAEFMETPRPHAAGPLLRPVTVAIDSGGHYGPQVAEFCKAGGPGYQALKGLARHRHDGYIQRRSVTADVLDRYGGSGLMLVGTNEAKASVFSLLRQSIAGAEPRPMVWPNDESRYGMLEFEGIVSETLVRVLDKRTGSTTLTWKKIGRANEPLDLLVYSLAVVNHLGVGFLLSEADAIRKAMPCAAWTPNTHHLEYGESLSWSPPAGAVKFLVWTQPRVQTYADMGVSAIHTAYGGAAPGWTEAGGYDIAADAKIDPGADNKGTPLDGAEATATGVTVTWAALVTLSQGSD